jgi:hypothetical protein
MEGHPFARRVIEGSDDDDLLELLHFLEQVERGGDGYSAADAAYMIRLVNESLDRRRRGEGR